MALSSTNFNVDVNLVNGTFTIEDVTNYTAQGVDPNNITGTIEISGPTGEIFKDASLPPNIDLSINAQSGPIAIEMLSDGTYEQGLYTFVYKVEDSSSDDKAELTKTFELCHKSPEVVIEVEADCVLPLLSSTDTTDYTVKGITPSKITRSHVLNFPIGTNTDPYKATTQRLTSDTFYTGTQTITITTDLTYDYPDGFYVIDRVEGRQEINVKCDNTICDLYCCLIAMYDRFRSAQSTNRTLAKELEEKWLRAEGLRNRIYDSYRCNKSEDVSRLVEEILKLGNCQPGCGCSDDKKPTLITAIGSTAADPTINITTFTGGTSSATATASNVGSGTGRVFSQKVADDLQFRTIKSGGNIQVTEDGDDIIISANIPAGGTTGSTVVNAGASVEVTTTVSGNITTFTVAVEQDLLDKINALYNTTLTAGDGIQLNETTDVDGNKQYEVVNSSLPLSSVELLAYITVDNSVITITKSDAKISGTDYTEPSVDWSNNNGSIINTPATRGAFTVKVSDFDTGSSSLVIPEVRLVGIETELNGFVQSLDLPIVPITRIFPSSVTPPGNRDFGIKFFGLDGLGITALRLQLLRGTSSTLKMTFSIKIT